MSIAPGVQTSCENLGGLGTPLTTADATAGTAERRRFRLAKAIAPELRLQPCLLLRSAANRWSKVFPICNRAAARVKAPKQDPKPGVLQDSPTADDRRWFPKNIGGRNSPVRALRHRFRRNLAAETANLP